MSIFWFVVCFTVLCIRRRGISLKIRLKYLNLKVVNKEVQYMEEGRQIVALFVMFYGTAWGCGAWLFNHGSIIVTILNSVIPHGCRSSVYLSQFCYTCRTNHSVRIRYKFFETVEQFRYLETTHTNQNSIPEDIKNRLKLGNSSYHSVKNLFVFQFGIQKCIDEDI